MGDRSPNLAKLLTVASVLPLSTADVERVFSDVTRTVTDLRSRLLVESTHKLLMIHRNDKYLDIERAAKRWLNKTYRRLFSL